MMRSNLARAAMLTAAAALPATAPATQPVTSPARLAPGPGEPVEVACPARPGWATLPADRVAGWAGGWRLVDWIGVRRDGGATWNGGRVAPTALVRNLERAAAVRPQAVTVLLRVPGAGCAALAALAELVEAGRACRPAICILSMGADDRPALLPTRPPPPPPVRVTRASADLAAYLSSDDYPAAALRAEEQGTANYRLDIGADGRVARCTITGSSGSAALDSATCRIMRSRARFEPARNAAGEPLPDRVTARIVWQLPAE
jgi:TonB family protein